MKNIISIALNSWSQQKQQPVLLFDSVAAASDVAFILGGQWDGCNGVVMTKCDEVAVNTAANLVDAKWCYSGTYEACLASLKSDELIKRYAAGERNFINANLRCAMLASVKLSEANLSYAKLNLANLSKADLSKVDLTAADLSEANLSAADLSQAYLVRTNLTKTDLQLADLSSANLTRANLSEVNLSHADLRGANLAYSDLRGANFHFCNLSGANLTGAKFIERDLEECLRNSSI
ncbi:MAG: pentapeptide repeat-containing protein [Tolypothrix carrinoi HA7290-LM1]|jgi:uncharacterized protein YjbI with pentapeptide repeats|nr:pentapeptide repeat-containing protein [Tolypothrix carrinoi HA7290-LM1]